MHEQPIWVPILAIVALATGSALYWYSISRAAAHFGDRFNFKVLVIINKLAAAGIFIFGIILLVKGLMSL